jgi:TetR/AcrR family transcriptional repressor of nem operon
MAGDTKTEILDSALRLTALKGFDAFSYRDIAKEVAIKTSSIHYYFPTKSDLAIALVDRYTAYVSAMMNELLSNGRNGYGQMKYFFGKICAISGEEHSLCLCGMLSADIHAVAPDAKKKLNDFFLLLEHFVEQMLKLGVEDGSIHQTIRPKSAAVEITAAIEGAMLLARVKDNPQSLQDTFDIILARLRA